MDTKILIVIRVGAASLHRSWSQVCAGTMDVAISLYDESTVDASEFVAVHRFQGPKFRGLLAFFTENAWIIDAYTHFWLIDDDIYLPIQSLLTIQDIVAQYGFALCAPSLAPESFFAWPITVQNTAFHLRATDFVEGMVPIMSRDFLRRALPMFGENHSGWGYEWLWRRILKDMRSVSAILDAAPIVHTRPVGTGTLYNNAEGGRIDALGELHALLAKYGIDMETAPFPNLFGVAREDRRLVFGQEFLALAADGYAFLQRHRPDAHRTCVEALVTSPPPFASVAQVWPFVESHALLAGARPGTVRARWRRALRGWA